MRDVIKKILKEEEGLDWIKQSKGEDSILDFVTDRIRVPQFRYMQNWDNRKMYDKFDEIYSALHFLESDLEEGLKAARTLLDSTNYKDLSSSLQTIEDYSMIGSMIESVRFGLIFFRPFIEETEYPLSDILTYLTNYYKN